MKPILKFAVFILLMAVALFFAACKKEKQVSTLSTPRPDSTISNKPPIANAGSDQIVFLPQDTVILNGTASYDPDGSISKFLWSKLSGPSILGPINIPHADSSVLTIKFITLGEYIFQLQVTDDKGATSKSTVKITLKENPAVGHMIKVKTLEYGTDIPVVGTDVIVCTSPLSDGRCFGSYTHVFTNSNGDGVFTADKFMYPPLGSATKVGYYGYIFNPCFVSYFKGGIPNLYNTDGDADSFVVRIVPKINFTLHLRDSSGRGSAGTSMYADIDFHNCVSMPGSLGTSLRAGIDTTFQVNNIYGNTNYWFVVGKDYDYDCECLQTILYRQVKYVVNGSVINITY